MAAIQHRLSMLGLWGLCQVAAVIASIWMLAAPEPSGPVSVKNRLPVSTLRATPTTASSICAHNVSEMGDVVLAR